MRLLKYSTKILWKKTTLSRLNRLFKNNSNTIENIGNQCGCSSSTAEDRDFTMSKFRNLGKAVLLSTLLLS